MLWQFLPESTDNHFPPLNEGTSRIGVPFVCVRYVQAPTDKVPRRESSAILATWKNLAKVTGFSLKRERPCSRSLGGPFFVCLSAWKVLGRRKWGGWECLEGRRPKGIPILPRREAPATASPACRRCRSRSLLQFAKRSAFQLDHVAVVE